MRRLLQIEWIKVKRYRAFWAILGIYAMLFLFVTSIFGMAETPPPSPTFFSFPDVWHRLANVASYLNLLPGILIIMLIANEYTFKTFRQNVIDGLSRAELIYSKFMLIGVVALLCMAFIFVWGLTRGLVDGRFDKLGDIYDKLPVLFNLFIQSAGYMSVAAFITIIFKKSAFSILIYIVYILALEPLIRWRTPDEIDRFFPMKIFGGVIPDSGILPMQDWMNASAMSPEMTLLIACGYILLFFGASMLLMQKSNL